MEITVAKKVTFHPNNGHEALMEMYIWKNQARKKPDTCGMVRATFAAWTFILFTSNAGKTHADVLTAEDRSK